MKQRLSAKISPRSAKRIRTCRFIRRCAPAISFFVSGQVAKDADGSMLSGTIEQETRGTIEAISRILAEEGATLSDVVRVTTYLEDARDFGRYNRVFTEYFRDAVLARTTVEARAVINTKIEMEAIAYKPK
jgi:enamine deaminase RidA (YjgF/YER057c/UK114 family)